jgi:hypothetical protein
MKKIGFVLLLTAIFFQTWGQEAGNEKQGENQLAVAPDTNENTKVVIGDNLLSIEDSKEATKFRVGNRGLNILESLEGPKISFERYTGKDNLSSQEKKENEVHPANFRRGFRGHWAGIELGFNNYLSDDNSTVMPADIYYMSLNSGKSINFNLNFAQQSFGFSKHIGIVTGLGINWNNYRFDGNNNIKKNDIGIIVIDSVDNHLEKSKFTTVYVTLPLMLEIQIPADNHHVNIAAGIIGAIKLGSHTKMVFENGDKIKSHDDLSLNLLRYGPTARIGYGNFQIFGTYYITPLFQTGKGPGGHELNPFEIGLAFTFHD